MVDRSTNCVTTPEQRVLTALSRRQPDRVPVLAYMNPYVRDWYSYLPSLADALAAIRQYCDVVYNWRVPAPLMFTAGERWIEQRDLGGDQTEQIIHTPDGPITEVVQGTWRERKVVKRWIQATEDVDRVLSMPHVPPRLDVDTFRATRARLAKRAVAQATFRGLTCLVDWIDERAMATWCADDRGLVRRLIGVAYERIANGLRRCLEAGVGPVYAIDAGRFHRLPAVRHADLGALVLDYERRLVELVHTHDGMYVIPEGPAPRTAELDDLCAIGMDGLTLADPPVSGDADLAAVKARLGDRVCLISTLAHDELAGASGAQIRQLVRSAVDSAASGGGLILNPCALPQKCDLSEQATNNLIAYIEAAHELGQYPG